MIAATPPVPNPASALRRELLALLACPEDGGTLAGWDGAQSEGTLRCATCDQTFAVSDGLPDLLPPKLRRPVYQTHDDAEKQREMAARDAQVIAYDRNLPLRLFSIVEIPLTLRYLHLEPDGLMLEGGCGTGRMTPAFVAAVRGLMCVDFSRESLVTARAKLSSDEQAKVLFVQADLSHLPLRSEKFDRVGSFQVLEHLPTAQARARAMAELARVLKPRAHGGRLALSAYRWGPPLNWLAPKQGHHDGGIPFFRATWEELAQLARPHLAVYQRTGALLYHFLLWGRKHS